MKLDNQCFKIDDARIAAVRRGVMTVEALALLLRPFDWLFQFKDTIYLFTQDQYYASQQLLSDYSMSHTTFNQILNQLPLNIDQKDNKYLQRIKKDSIQCSKCKYNGYKTRVRQIINKYPQLLQRYKLSVDKEEAIASYPAHKSNIVSKAQYILPQFFYIKQYKRQPCLDCVQKHISMAYIKGCEAQKGYPHHLAMAVANLQQAYQECPEDIQFLREHIMFCIAKTIKDKKAFIPIQNIITLIQLARSTTKIAEANIKNDTDSQYQLLLSQKNIEQLQKLDVITKAKLSVQIEKLIAIINSDKDNLSVLFQGQASVIEDMLLPVSKDISNILRNRRLIFKLVPHLIKDTEYNYTDILNALRKKNQNA